MLVMKTYFAVILALSVLSPASYRPPTWASPRIHNAAQSAAAATAPLASFRVTGSHRWTTEQILPITGLKIGAPVSREEFQSLADRLSSLGLFSAIRYSFDSTPKGVALEFVLTDANAFPVSFDNFPWFTDQEITQAIQKDGIPFDGTAPQDGTILDAIDQSIGKLLASRKIQGDVEHHFLPSVGGQSVQQFRLVGPGIRIGSVDYSDSLAKSDHDIQQLLQELVGKTYSRATIELFDYEQVRPIYLERGYLHVKFGEPQPHLNSGVNQALPDSVPVTVVVDPGTVFLWGGANWNGNSAIPTSQFAALETQAGLKSGEVAGGVKVAHIWTLAKDLYGHLGYLDVKIDPVPDFPDSTTARYRVEITEGPQYHMGNLVLSGLSLEGERRIRAAWHLSPGQVFDDTYFQDFLAKGAKQAFGDLPFHYEKIGHYLDTNPQAATVNVMLDFQ